jgi:hypothetical protein
MKKCVCKEFLKISNKVIPNLDWDFQKGAEYQYEVEETESQGEIYYITTVDYINRDFFRGYPLRKNMFKKHFRANKETVITEVVQVDPVEDPIEIISEDLQYWSCIIGPITKGSLAYGSDFPLRQIVQEKFIDMTGEQADHCWTGWGLKEEVASRILSIQNLHITDPTGEKAKAIDQILRS